LRGLDNVVLRGRGNVVLRGNVAVTVPRNGQVLSDARARIAKQVAGRLQATRASAVAALHGNHLRGVGAAPGGMVHGATARMSVDLSVESLSYLDHEPSGANRADYFPAVLARRLRISAGDPFAAVTAIVRHVRRAVEAFTALRPFPAVAIVVGTEECCGEMV